MNSAQKTVTLEDKLFKNSIYLGLFGTSLLLIYDVFFTGDFLSIIAEIVALTFFLLNFRILEKRKSSDRHRLIFSLGLLIIMSFGWITGGGMSILLATELFLVIEFILVVNSVKIFKGSIAYLIA